MQIRNRLFPYPILNEEQDNSTYHNKSLQFVYEEEDDDNYYILKGVQLSTNSEYLKELFEKGLAKALCIVECSKSVYRKSFKINIGTSIPEIKIAKNNLIDKFVVSAFVYAAADIEISSNEFNDDYKDITFSIDKYSILAASDGYSNYSQRDERKDNVASSIFSIIPNNDQTAENTYKVNLSDRKIEIVLSKGDFKNYELIYRYENYKEIFFSMILVHALEIALIKVKQKLESEEIDDIASEYKWLLSIRDAYENLEGKDFDRDSLADDNNICLIAQKLLGNPLNKSLKNLVLSVNKIGESNDE